MSLVWEGLDLQPAHRRWRFAIVQGRDELPAARTTSDLVPFRPGRLHRPGFADVRQLEVRGYIQEPTLAGFRSSHDTLKGLLDPGMAAPGILVDGQEDGTERWIRAVPRTLMSKYGGGGTRILSIELEALDPFWYDSYGNATLDSGLFLDDGEFLDDSAWIVVAPTAYSFDVPLTIPGTADSERVRVQLTGPTTAPVGVEIVGVPPIGFRHPAMVAGTDQRILLVDNHARTAILGIDRRGASTRANLTFLAGNRHGEFIRFPPGTQIVRIVGQPTEARFQFMPTYL